MAHRFVGWPADGSKTYLYSAKDTKSKKFRQVLWGDFLSIEDDDGVWLTVIWARNDPAKRKQVFIQKAHTVATRPLEIIFLDVGQGDGAVLITPEADANEKIIVIDAGPGNNVARFLNGRFKAYRGFNFHAAVITHPDKDHYFGFREIFANPKIGFERIYHSGLIERPVSGTYDKLGTSAKDTSSGLTFQTELAGDRADFELHFADPAAIGDFDYPAVMHAALNNPKIDAFAMLSTGHGTLEDGRAFMPGFAPSDGRPYTIEVLGPVLETCNGAPALRRLGGSYGETKNGHSVILRLQYGKFSVLFGGDLNEAAEKFLMRHYAKLKQLPEAGTAAYRSMVDTVAQRFRAEVMKSCHHGSSDVTDAFLEIVRPAAFVISSGDEEGHVHPRPDLLGRLGNFGRGGAPVILSTEILRSTRELEDAALKVKIDQLIDGVAANPTPAWKTKLKDLVAKFAKTNVEVYGAIYLKTDGERLMTAFKLETGSDIKKWFYYGYDILPNGELVRDHNN